MYSIEIENLTKKFKEKTAVNNVSLKIKQGELFSLLGTNGAGKTTTIKMLSTLILPTSGNIKINGLDINKDKQKIKEILNVSPQETAIAMNLSVKENLEFMAGVYQIKNPKENAVKFYANMFFYYSMYDGAADKAKVKSRFEHMLGIIVEEMKQ